MWCWSAPLQHRSRASRQPEERASWMKLTRQAQEEVEAHSFNMSTQEAETVGSLSQPGL